MPKFILAYHSEATPQDPEAGKEHMQRYMEWMESVGDALVSPSNPLGPSKIISEDGVRDQAAPGALMMGYSILEADDLDAAVDITKRCPFLEIGTIRVAQIMDMPRGATATRAEGVELASDSPASSGVSRSGPA